MLASCSGRQACARSSVRASRQRHRRQLQVSALLKPAEGVGVSWRQTTDEVIIKVPVAAGTRGRDVDFEVHPSRLRLTVDGQTLLAGSLDGAGAINVDECFWVLEDPGEAGPTATPDHTGRYVAISLAKRVSGFESWETLLEDDAPDDSITHRVALDVQVGERVGRLVLGLYGNVVPRTVQNFVSLVEGWDSPSGKQLCLRGSPFHRIIPGFMAQGGDITAGDGTGGASIFGPSFEDENFKLKHGSRGVVAMANAGPNTNNSQFYITFMPTPHLDGKHVVFGCVEAGWQTLMMMEAEGSDSGAPSSGVTITDCRLLPLEADPQGLVDELAAAQRDVQLAAEFAEALDKDRADAAPPPAAPAAAEGA